MSYESLSVLCDAQEHNINTYLSHKWVAKVDGKAVKTWIINERKAKQKFVLSKHDLA